MSKSQRAQKILEILKLRQHCTIMRLLNSACSRKKIQIKVYCSVVESIDRVVELQIEGFGRICGNNRT